MQIGGVYTTVCQKEGILGGVYTTVCQKEGILLKKYRDRNGRYIAILFKSIGVRGRFDSPE